MKQISSLIILDAINKLNGVNTDINSIVREFAIGEEELTKEEFLRILKNKDFVAKLKTTDISGTKKYPTPMVFILKDNSYGLILKINYVENKALVFIPTKGSTEDVTFEQFRELSAGEIIVLRHKTFDSQVAFGFKWFFYEILKFKQVIAEVFLGSFIVQLFGLVTPLFTQVILDKVIVHRSMTTLDVLAIAFVVIAGFELLLNLSRNYIFLHTANKLDAKLGAKLFKHLFSLPFNYFESRKVGNIIARVRELDTIREFITNKSVSVIIDTIFSVVFLVMMFIYSPKLSFIALAFISLIGILYVLITPELRARLENKFQMGAQSNSYLVESTTGIQTVKSLAIEGSMQKKWEEYLGKYVKSSFNLSNISNISGNISGVLQKLMTISILYFGVKLVIDNKLTIGQLIAFQMFSNQLVAPIIRLLNLWNEFQQTLLAVDRLGDILNHPAEIQSSKAIALPNVKGSIKFDNVSFRYASNTPDVLKNISFNIPENTTVGIVGQSGSGKSTITKLIQRLYLINNGAIYLDGIDVRHMNPLWLRYNIGVVLQESYLFSGTIEENISMPVQSVPIEKVIEASKIAGADEFITKLPEGYNTMVGERGSTLSGGQRQRIAIARALISNPKIIIFDEATSALDYESERIICSNLNKIKDGKTMIIVAHRLSMVKDCDNILVLKDGVIIEEGNHQELMRKNGYYKSLYSQQESTV